MSRRPDDFKIEIEPKDDSQYFIGEEDSSKKSDEFLVKLDKLMDRLKLISLEMDKKSADLEIKIGKLEEKFKDVMYDFPKLKETTDNIENQLNVINLGLMDFKKTLSDIDSRVLNLEKIPSTVGGKIEDLGNKLKNAEDDIQKIYLKLGDIETIKKDVTSNLEGIIGIKEGNLKNEIINNKAGIDDLKKRLDTVSLAMKSFERTVELTNIDDIIKRFDSFDRRMLDLEVSVQKLMHVSNEPTITASDVEVFKERLKEISITVMNALDRMNKFEMVINNRLIKTEELSRSFERIEALKSVTDDVKEQVKVMREIQNSVQDLYGKIMTIYDSGKIGWNKIQNVAREVPEIERLKTDIEDIKKIVEWLVSKNESRII